MTTLVAALTWVPQGYAAQEPRKYVLDDEEYSRISRLAQLQLDDAREDRPEEIDAEETKVKEEEDGKEDDELKEYNLDTYDDDSAEEEDKTNDFGIFSNVKGLTYYANEDEDPYITLKDDGAGSDDEREELQILPTDNLIVSAKIEDDVSYLEVYVYESSEDNLYVHHDIMLPSQPLCVEWINYNTNSNVEDGTRRGNMAAIGTFDPDIEIWDLDVLESIYPDTILGAGANKSESTPAESSSSKNKKKKKKKKKAVKGPNEQHHVDAVMCLSSNRLQRNLLLSGSADTTVKLWDLAKGSSSSCVKSYAYHGDKVSAIQWHPTEAFYALSGCYDRVAIAADFRTTEGVVAKWKFNGDVEGVKWDPHDPNYFYVSLENGTLQNYDIRAHSNAKIKPLWTLQAHDAEISSFDVSNAHPGLIVTGSVDKLVKLWHIPPGQSGPSLVLSRDLDLGRIFSTQFAPDKDVGMRIAVAGSTGSVKIWDLSTSSAARKAFGLSARTKESVEEGKVVGLSEVPDEEEDDEVHEEGEQEEGENWQDMDDN